MGARHLLAFKLFVSPILIRNVVLKYRRSSKHGHVDKICRAQTYYFVKIYLKSDRIDSIKGFCLRNVMCSTRHY